MRLTPTFYIKLTFEIHSDEDSGVEGYPQRAWTIEIWLQNEHGGADVPATCYEKVTYDLHPTFESRAHQSKPLNTRPFGATLSNFFLLFSHEESPI